MGTYTLPDTIPKRDERDDARGIERQDSEKSNKKTYFNNHRSFYKWYKADSQKCDECSHAKYASLYPPVQQNIVTAVDYFIF